MSDEDWLALLPPAVLDSAYRTQNEYAWPRDLALQVVTLAEQAGFHIIGVDIWLPTTSGPTIPMPYIYDWDLEHAATDIRGFRTAHDFIIGFEWDSADAARDREPYFNLCIDRLDS